MATPIKPRPKPRKPAPGEAPKPAASNVVDFPATGPTDDPELAEASRAKAAAEEPTEFTLNDAGNAALLIELHGRDMSYVRELGRGTWLSWTGHGWEPGEDAANRHALDVPKRLMAEAGKLDQLAGAALANGDKKAAAPLARRAKALHSWATVTGNDPKLKAMLRQAWGGTKPTYLAMFVQEGTVWP